MKIISIVGQKGGIGKTTLTFNIGAGLARRGKRVLLVDLDSQRNLTKYALKGYDPTQKNNSFAEIVLDGFTFGDVICENVQGIEGFAIIPASESLERLDEQIATFDFSPLEATYDYVLIDNPPTMKGRVISAILASEGALLPATATSFSYDGIKQVAASLKTLDRKIIGIVLNEYMERLCITKKVVDDLKFLAARLGVKVYNRYIRESVAVKESALMQEDIFSYGPKSAVAEDFAEIVNELLGED